MLNKLKNILNTYTFEELENMDFWVNSNSQVNQILIDEYSIDLITNNMITSVKEDE